MRMRIHRLTALHVPIRLRKKIRHASHERTANETLLIRCVMDDGHVGWGEGLPRTYVTGESMESAWRQLQHSDFQPLQEMSFSSALEIAQRLRSFSLANTNADAGVRTRECFGNSVRCALELAILDAACRSEGISLSTLVRQLMTDSARQIRYATPSLLQDVAEVRYSGAVTSESPFRQCVSALKMRIFGFHQVKVKVGARDLNDAQSLSRVRRIVGPRVDLRLDANEAWKPDDVIRAMQPLLRFSPTCLEQPVLHDDVAALQHIRPRLSVPVMLDESLCCIEDAQRAADGGWCDLFNLRLSKCGGLVRTLELAAFAAHRGIGYQLGCQVGETGILSAAGRHLATQLAGIRYLEGSFDRFLVHDRLTEQDLTFGYGGRAPALKGPGLSVNIDECRIRQLAKRSLSLCGPVSANAGW